MVIEVAESIMNELGDYRESMKRAELALHSDLVKLVKILFDKKVEECTFGSSLADVFATAATVGMLLVGRNTTSSDLNALARGARSILHDDKENKVMKLARGRRPEIDLLSTEALFHFLEKLNLENIQDVLTSDWS